MSDSALYKTALYKAMALCSRREYCVHDINEKIETWGVGSSDSEKIIGLLKEEKFIDDERFAKAFARDKFNYNKWGRLKISVHLKVKKIPSDIIRVALDSIDNELYLKVLKDLMRAHQRSVKAKNQYDLKAKMLRYGLSKGFESNLLYDILNETEE
jgi:regulatory protein